MGYLRGLRRPWQGLRIRGVWRLEVIRQCLRNWGLCGGGTLLRFLKLALGCLGTFHGWFFRMELQDFLTHFNTVQICSLSPEVLGPSPAGGGWHIHTFQGRWVRGFNSGGSQPSAGEAWGPLRSILGGLWQGGNSTTFLLFRQKTSGPIPSSG